MEDTGLVYVYYASAWQRIGALEELDNSVGTSATTTTSYTAMATVNLTIPTHWASWKAHAIATWQHHLSVAGKVTTNYKLNIDGTEGATTTGEATGITASTTLQSRRTGITTTGSRGIALFGKHTGAVHLRRPGLPVRPRQSAPHKGESTWQKRNQHRSRRLRPLSTRPPPLNCSVSLKRNWSVRGCAA